MKWLHRFGALVLALVLLCPAAMAQRLTDQELSSYYSDAVVVGDSLPRMLRNYLSNLQSDDPTFFEGMRFFTYYSYRLKSAARETINDDEVNLVYKGQNYVLCKLMEKLRPGKLFILAGLNDKIGDKPETGMEYVEEIMRLMAQYAPDTQVYFFSITPVTARADRERPNLQKKWDAYNEMLKHKCAEVGAIYVEIAERLKNENGLLPAALSHDGLYHLNDEGNKIWVEILLDFAQSRYDAGSWKPGEGGY